MSTKEKRIATAVERALDGLYTDGAHHKQWALEQVLESLLTPSELKKLQAREARRNGALWQEGIAP